MFYKEGCGVGVNFAQLIAVTFWKGVFSKEFAPFGSKLFPVIVDFFSEGRQN